MTARRDSLGNPYRDLPQLLPLRPPPAVLVDAVGPVFGGRRRSFGPPRRRRLIGVDAGPGPPRSLHLPVGRRRHDPPPPRALRDPPRPKRAPPADPPDQGRF